MDWCPLYDVNNDQVSKMLFTGNGWKRYRRFLTDKYSDFKAWQQQTHIQFGFIPLGNLIRSNNVEHVGTKVSDPIEQHYVVKATDLPNFLGARLLVQSQLNIAEWRHVFADYWDQQLLDMIQFGFPIDFNRNSPLASDAKNHTSANQFPNDIQA